MIRAHYPTRGTSWRCACEAYCHGWNDCAQESHQGDPMACVHGYTHVAECAECTAPPTAGRLRRTIVNDLDPSLDISGGWYDRGYRKGFAHTGVDGLPGSEPDQQRKAR